MKRMCLSLLLLTTVVLLGRPAWAQRALEKFVPVTDAMLQKPDPSDWLMWRRTLDSWGYSPLDQVNVHNVKDLKMIWSRPMGIQIEWNKITEGMNEATPLVYDGVMYMANPDDVIEALDARTGDPIWKYRREWPEDLSTYLANPGRSRNIAIYDNLIINTSGDSYVFALDARSGELVWETQILDYKINAAQRSSGPIIAKGKIISGRNCYSEGGPEACVITAHDAKTGRELWRTHTIPKPGEPGDETWEGVPYERRWHVGTWMVPSYDPELQLIYIGTSVTSPAPKFMLGSNDGKYLYHNSTLALDVDTGKIVWYYQHLVDHWDFDHTFERLLIDTVVAPDPAEVPWINPNISPGERRRVVTGIPGKSGIVYTLDRETGEFLWARPTVTQNVVDSIDGASGNVTVNPEVIFTAPGQTRLVCPGWSGGKNWPPGAYSPLKHTMYFPLQNTCMSATSNELEPSFDFLKVGGRQQSRYGIQQKPQIAQGTDKVGRIEAVAVDTGKTVWKYEQRAGMLALLATGGGLLFAGDADGHLRALDQSTGQVLWDVSLGAPLDGPSITFAINGKQYVAVSTGTSAVSSTTNRLTPELKPGSGNTIFVFALP